MCVIPTTYANNKKQDTESIKRLNTRLCVNIGVMMKHMITQNNLEDCTSFF